MSDYGHQKEWLKTKAGQIYLEKHREYQKQWRLKNAERIKKAKDKSTKAIRREALERYGGIPPSCRICGSNRKLRISPALPKQDPYWMRRMGWPADFRVLCFSCVRQQRSRQILEQKPWLDPETGKHRNWQRVEVHCSFCGKGMFKKRVHLKYTNHFCNNECHGRWKSANLPKGPAHPRWRRVQIPCAQCGLEVIAKQSRITGKKTTVRRHGIFCSPECHDDWRSENITGDKLYNWEGGWEPYYGPTWPSAKRKARERDNHTCQNPKCGITREELGKNMDVHHKIAFKKFGKDRHEEANSLSNLISYCYRCHKRIEEKEKKMAARAK